jgi:glucokinase
MYIGVDLGGTKITAAVVDIAGGGRVLARQTIATDSHEGPAAVLDRLAGLAEAVRATAGIEPSGIEALGLGVPGPFDPVTGRTLFLPNLVGMWRDVPVVEHLRARIACPIALINDARAFVLAEAVFGAGRAVHTVCGFTVGTGIGGGIAIGGQLHGGLNGTAGEMGHMTIDPHGPVCGCGNQGCLEMYASGPAITSLALQALVHGRETAIRDLAGNDPRQVTPELVLRAAQAGDGIAGAILRQACEALGVGVANAVTMLSPNLVVIGGSVARLGDVLFETVRAVVRRRCLAVPAAQVRIVPAVLGGDAGAIGAAEWAAQRLREQLTGEPAAL